MDASSHCCPNLECIARGKVGQGTLVSHGWKGPRSRCKICGKTSSRTGGHDVCRCAHADRGGCTRGEAAFVWLSSPGDCAGNLAECSTIFKPKCGNWARMLGIKHWSPEYMTPAADHSTRHSYIQGLDDREIPAFSDRRRVEGLNTHANCRTFRPLSCHP